MEKLSSPKKTIEIIQKYNFDFQKKFGQNFLIDSHVLEKIIDAANITKDDFVLEIGPGIGTMTQYLSEHAREMCIRDSIMDELTKVTAKAPVNVGDVVIKDVLGLGVDIVATKKVTA